jgi:hypothetical protein
MVGSDDQNGQTGRVSSPGGSARVQGRQASARTGAPARRAGAAVGPDRDTGGLSGKARNVKEKAEGNPLAAGALALAAGFFIASRFRPSAREQSLARQAFARLDTFKDEAVGMSRQFAGELQRSAKQGLEQVKDTAATVATDALDELQESAKGLGERARDVTDEARQSAKRVVSEAKGEAKPTTARRRSSGSGGTRSTSSRSSTAGQSGTSTRPRSAAAKSGPKASTARKPPSTTSRSRAASR